MNNEQIDNTSYYELPSGRQLEAFMAEHHLSFAEGSALKYLWRAGKKDGESAEKDRAKAEHFIRFIAMQEHVEDVAVRIYIGHLIELAQSEYKNNGFISHCIATGIYKHYGNAVKKHPYFCDTLTPPDYGADESDGHLRVLRNELKSKAESGRLSALDILNCEIEEMLNAIIHGDVENAVKEAYDVNAVTLRIIDVLEHRQKLGKPKTIAERYAEIKDRHTTVNPEKEEGAE